VENLLAAAATGLAAGLDLAAVLDGASAAVVVPGRMERVDAGQPFAVIVDYAHTPAGLEAVLPAARAAAEGSGGKLLVVFGAGGDRDRAKRPVMGSVAAAVADQVWVTSDNPRSEDPVAIIDEILAGIPVGAHAVTHVQPDRRAAIGAALSAARDGDVVVIAGKGHETGQTAGNITIPFDDRLVAREELERMSHDCGHPA
jgi:UDP-N-acetylmuramoyl-L-alanyl-D-glutamate--2,6-diaminopimelate ligase